MRLDDLRESCLGCKECGLAERRTHVVFGEGNPDAPLLLVGEGPGEEEDKSGRPFVGRAGQLLDKALIENNLTREHVYICNTVKCRAADWTTGRPVNRPPTDTEAQTCRKWLLPQIETVAPKVVLCVGAPSAKNLIRPDFRITLERGKLFRSTYARAIMATLHPSYVLRQMYRQGDTSYSYLVSDISKAWTTATQLKEKSESGTKFGAAQMGLDL